MSRLPDRTALGARSIPQPQRGIVRVGGPVPAEYDAQSFEGERAIGGALAAYGSGRLKQKYADEDRFDVARAKAHWLKAKIAADNAFADDPDYTTYEPRYGEILTQATDEAAGLIRGSQARALFVEELAPSREAALGDIQGLARSKEKDIGRSQVLETLDAIRAQALAVGEGKEREELLRTAQDLLAGAVARGYYGHEEAVKTKIAFGTDYAEAWLTMQSPEDRISLLSGAALPGTVLGRTSEGRPVIANEDGGISTEITATVEDPRTPGRWINIPTIFGGKMGYSEEQALAIIAEAGFKDPDTGRAVKTYGSIEEAEAAAQARTAALDSDPGVQAAMAKLRTYGARSGTAIDFLQPDQKAALFAEAQDEIYQEELRKLTVEDKLQSRAEREAKLIGDTLGREGYTRYQDGTLDRAWIDEAAPYLSPTELQGFYKLLEPQQVEVDEPSIIVDLEAALADGEDIAVAATNAFRGGLMKPETYIAYMSKNRSLKADEGIPTPYKQGKDLIRVTLDPGALSGYGETAYRAAQAQAMIEFDTWREANPKATRAETLDEAQQIIKRYQVLKFEEMSLATGLPRFYAGTREQLKAGDAAGLDAAEVKVVEQFQAGAISREQRDQELRKIESWRAILSKTPTGTK